MDNSTGLFVYILRLKHGKYYVGSTKNLLRRIEEHKESLGNGAVWTQKHKVVFIERVVENADKYDEDKYTEMMMEKYGIENVRGGSYVKETLEDHQIRTLETKLKHVKEMCFRCGSKTHFVKDCYISDRSNIKKPEKHGEKKIDKELGGKGSKWTKEEEKLLCTRFNEGMHIKDIAKLHSRTTRAIESRLVKLGKIKNLYFDR